MGMWVCLSDSFIFTVKKNWRSGTTKSPPHCIGFVPRLNISAISRLGAVTIALLRSQHEGNFPERSIESARERNFQVVCETHIERQSSVVVLSWKLIHSIISFSWSDSANCFRKQEYTLYSFHWQKRLVLLFKQLKISLVEKTINPCSHLIIYELINKHLMMMCNWIKFE